MTVFFSFFSIKERMEFRKEKYVKIFCEYLVNTQNSFLNYERFFFRQGNRKKVKGNSDKRLIFYFFYFQFFEKSD